MAKYVYKHHITGKIYEYEFDYYDRAEHRKEINKMREKLGMTILDSPIKRKCLKCDHEFMSEQKNIRMCDTCRTEE